jgi:hypothetical protein
MITTDCRLPIADCRLVEKPGIEALYRAISELTLEEELEDIRSDNNRQSAIGNRQCR